MSERDHDVEKKFDSGVQELWRQEFPPSCFGIHTCHKKMGVLIKKGTEKRGGIRFRRIGQFKTGLQLEPFLNPFQFTVSYEVLSNPFQVATPYRQGRKHGVIVSPWLNHTACMIGAFPFLSPVHIVVLSTRWIISGSFLTGSPLRNLWCCAKLTELLVWRNEKKKRLSHLWTLTKCCFTGLNGISRVGGLLNSGFHFFSHKLDIAVRKESIVLKCFNNLLQL